MIGTAISSHRAVSALSKALVALVVLTLIGAGLRFYQLGAQSIWFDEAYSIYVANQPVWDIITGIEPSHLPFYFVLLKVWMFLFGQSEVAVRLLSVVFGVALIPALFLLARRMFGQPIGLITSFFAAISPFLIYYSQETRPYELLALQAVITTYFLLRALDDGRWWWIAYGLSSATMLYTHYYGVLFFGAQSLFVLILLVLRHRESIVRPVALRWMIVEIVLALAFFPWMLQRAVLFSSYVTGDAGSSSVDYMFWKTITSFALGHSVESLNPSMTDPSYLIEHNLAVWLSLGFLVMAWFGIVVALNSKLRHTLNGGANEKSLVSAWRPWLLPVVLIVATSLAIYVATGTKRGFTSRYVISLAPFYYLLVGCGLEVVRRELKLLLVPIVVLLVGAMAFALNNYYTEPKYARDDFRSAAGYIQQHASLRDTIVCDASNTQYSLDYYYQGAVPRVALSDRLPIVPVDAEATLASLAKQNDVIWLITWQDYYSDPAGNVKRWLDTHTILKTQESFHGGILVRGYMPNPPIVLEGSLPNPRFDYLENKLALVGYQCSPLVSGQEWNVTLYFKVLAPIEKDYTLFIHLLGSDGQPWMQRDAQPYDGHYPTSQWVPGQIVKIENSVKIPAFSPSTAYQLELGFYELATMERIGSAEKHSILIDAGWMAAGNDVLPKTATKSGFDFGGKVVLRGYEVGEVHAGTPVLMTSYWQTRVAPAGDYTVFLHLLDQKGNLIAQKDSPPGLAAFPTSQWAKGQTVVDYRSLQLPSDLPSGSYKLVAGVYDTHTGQRLPIKPHWWDRSQDKVEISQIEVP
jgi:4-amino-4-deoxy-L-arabinose transferase-like glycosyltransferase